MKSGKVLAADRAGDPWYPASITKLMTAYVVMNAVKKKKLTMRSRVVISQRANKQPPSKMGFKVGTELTVRNALKMLIVKSANDIATALAETVSGNQEAFVQEMNATARRIGMVRTQFRNPHGLHSASQFTTARDMAVLAIRLYNEHPGLHRILRTSSIRAGKTVIKSHNLLLEHYRGAIGMKTGFVCAAGLNMVGAAQRSGKRLVTVVLGEHSSIDRAEKAALLLEQGFQGKYKKRYGSLRSYKPRATRSGPVNMRPVVCNRTSKIRNFQIVVPPKKPKFAGRYKSPQRKFFMASLGDTSHPQGALVVAPRGRTYRSHILQPRIPLQSVAYNTGLGADAADFAPVAVASAGTVQGSTQQSSAQASLFQTQQTQSAANLAFAQPALPIPQRRPLVGQTAAVGQQTANAGSLYAGGGEIGAPLDLRTSRTGLPIPRRRPGAL